jgi:GNAT superfamily N-acetyltransferase
MKNLDEATFKWLDGDELDQLEPILAEKGWPSLNHNTSRALAVYDKTDGLVAWYVFQLFPHCEPMYVEPEWRGSGVAEELVDVMHKFLSSVKCRGVMIVADNPAVARMAEAHGMKKIESPVYLMVGGREGV